MDARGLIDEVAPLDLEGRVVWLPVRHHSPGCARRVAAVIRARRPDAVLIEGPRDATRWIPALLNPQTRCPVAIFTTYVKTPLLRHGGWYPLCDYSPEMAALRAASEVGASARFIDLTFPEMVEAGGDATARTRSLLDDGRLQHGAFLRAACRRARVRDADDLWDHLFETDDRPPQRYFSDVLAYCALSRRGYDEAALRQDGTLAREAAMAYEVGRERGTVVVVTGGFHTVALPTCAPAAPRPVACLPDDAQVLLTRYGFAQLDALNGYASGMPAPELYQRLWEGEDPLRLLVEVGVGTPADAIEAVAHARRLADFRGHARPSREDLLDSIRSVYVKGAVDIEGVEVLAQARRLFVGHRVGSVPAAAGAAPLIVDFQQNAAALGLAHDDPAARRITLDVWRKPKHRRVSRFLHRLRFLGVPFARCLQGPKFRARHDDERVHEIWTYAWTPHCDAALVKRSVYGARVVDACEARLRERLADSGVDAAEATRVVLDALQMGMHAAATDVVRFASERITAEVSLLSLGEALLDLELLHAALKPLEATDVAGLSDLRHAAYVRACSCLDSVADTPAASRIAALDAMIALTSSGKRLDESLHLRGLGALAEGAEGDPAIRGGACGLLFDEDRLDADALARRLRGHLLLGAEAGAAFLLGVLRTARHALWDVADLLAAVDEHVRGWSDAAFAAVTPSLRQALADLTPRECDRVAARVAPGLPPSPIRGFTEADMRRALRIDGWLRETSS